MSLIPKQILDRLTQKLTRLESLRPLPVSAVQKLKEQFEIEMTYNSNAIEGNSLTLKETYLVINEGITIRGKPLKDHLEAKDHHQALEYLYELIGKDSKPTISEQLTRSLHQMVMKKTDKEYAGKYRISEVFIAGSDHIPPNALRIPSEMEKLISWYRQEKRHLNPIELSALFHHKLVSIHPFYDGNGRVSRLMMNVLLMKEGYPLVVILKNDGKKYYRVLSRADEGDYIPLVKFTAQAIEQSLDIYLKALSPSTETTEKYFPLAAISKSGPYSAKYLNLLVRQGKLEAHKQGRNWITSHAAVQRYITARERKRGR